MTDPKASLLSLPTEVLTLILSYCHQSWNDDTPRDSWANPDENPPYPPFSGLCLTCRRLRDIALPLLYSIINLSNQQKIAGFLRHMKENPVLAGHILYLTLSLPFSQRKPDLDQVWTPRHGLWRLLGEPDLISGWPDDRGLGGRLPLQNLVCIALGHAMIPLSVERLPSDYFVLPALEECYFQFGALDVDDGVSYYQVHVAGFFPFWTAPRLKTFSINGSGMHIIGGDHSNMRLNHGPSTRLKDLESLHIGCQIDAMAVKELTAYRMTRCLHYVSLFEVRPGCHFNDYASFLAPGVKDLSYLWFMDHAANPQDRRPHLSPFIALTSLRIPAQVLANFSIESKRFHRVELLCRFPHSLKHLEIRVEPRLTHRRQFYELLRRTVEEVLSNLDSLTLRMESVDHLLSDDYYWHSRLVSEEERWVGDVAEDMLYSTNGQTVEHDHLRQVCQNLNLALLCRY